MSGTVSPLSYFAIACLDTFIFLLHFLVYSCWIFSKISILYLPYFSYHPTSILLNNHTYIYQLIYHDLLQNQLICSANLSKFLNNNHIAKKLWSMEIWRFGQYFIPTTVMWNFCVITTFIGIYFYHIPTLKFTFSIYLFYKLQWY